MVIAAPSAPVAPSEGSRTAGTARAPAQAPKVFDGVQTTGAAAERLCPRRHELREHRQGSAHGGRRNQHGDHGDRDFHREQQRGAVGRRVIEPRQNGLHGAEQRVHPERGHGGDDLENGERPEWAAEARREPAEKVAAEAEPDEERRERRCRGRRRRAKEHREAAHPQDLVRERGGAREEEKPVESSRRAAAGAPGAVSGRWPAQRPPVR